MLTPLRIPGAAAPVLKSNTDVKPVNFCLSWHKHLYRTPKLLWKLGIPVTFIPFSLWHLLQGMNVTVCLPVCNSELSPDSQ